MTNAFDPTLGITPSIPFVYGERPKNQWRLLGASPKDAPHPYQDHELVINDLGGGLNKVRGEIFPHYLGVDLGHSNRTSNANGIDVSYPGQAILSTFFNVESVWRGSATYCSIDMPGYQDMFIGSGSTANLSLWRETSNAPGLTAVTFTPGGAIMSLSAGVFSGTSPVMVIGMLDVFAVTLATNLSTTATMNYNATLWGLIVSPLNASAPGTPTNVLYLGQSPGASLSSVTTISGDQAATAANVDTGTRFNSGGYAVGIANVAVTPGNLVPRLCWVVPRIGSPNGMFASAPQLPVAGADLIHTNLYGTDPQKLITNLPSIVWAMINEGVLYYTDGFNIAMNDGKEQDLGWNYEREQDSDYKYLCTGLGFAAGQLVAAVSRLNLTTVASSQMWLEKYDAQLKVWQPESKVITPNITSTASDLGPGVIERQVSAYPLGGGLPYSRKSQMLYYLPLASTGNEKDYYEFIGPTGYSHFWNYRYTTGSTHAGFKTEATGTWDSPALSMPWPLKGLPTVCLGIGIYGDMLAGGNSAAPSTTSSATVTLASQGITGALTYPTAGTGVYHKVQSRDGYRWSARYTEFKPNRHDFFNYLKFRISLAQDSSRTDWTPNPLPIVIRMRTFLDGWEG